jgi:hypothetical protein
MGVGVCLTVWVLRRPERGIHVLEKGDRRGVSDIQTGQEEPMADRRLTRRSACRHWERGHESIEGLVRRRCP